MRSDNTQKYHDLRKAFPEFIYDTVSIEKNERSLKLRFHFILAPGHHFYPSYEFPLQDYMSLDHLQHQTLEDLAFHIGMVEAMSYWKTACCPRIRVRPRSLNAEQQLWWKKLWLLGLGEFFYLNSVDPDPEDFIEFTFDQGQMPDAFRMMDSDTVMVPIGGGKDSAVTLGILKESGAHLIPLIMNPRGASIKTTEIEGFRAQDLCIIHRTLDPHLIELNAQGFLNGHTPFSALLAFNTLLAAALSGAGKIALSNESSANEATVAGSGINHQYSKSYEFERDFRHYVQKYITPDISYFSFLRPLHEIQIAQLFADMPRHHHSFRSCNAGSKSDSWCGACAKCLFTYIILSPFIESETLKDIFGKDLWQDASLIPVFEELYGCAEVKPFECIGTIEEVNAALCLTLDHTPADSLPLLLKHYSGSDQYRHYRKIDLAHLREKITHPHFLEPIYIELLKTKLHV